MSYSLRPLVGFGLPTERSLSTSRWSGRLLRRGDGLADGHVFCPAYVRCRLCHQTVQQERADPRRVPTAGSDRRGAWFHSGGYHQFHPGGGARGGGAIMLAAYRKLKDLDRSPKVII